MLTAAVGPLAIEDLAVLTNDLAPATSAWSRQVDRLVTEQAARSLQPVGPADRRRYQFAHGSLLEQAQTDPSLRILRHPEYRRRIDRWADLWRDAGWPVPAGEDGTTPLSLLDTYPSTLKDHPRQLVALAADTGWLDAAWQTVGVDRVLADVGIAQSLGTALALLFGPGEDAREALARRVLSAADGGKLGSALKNRSEPDCEAAVREVTTAAAQLLDVDLIDVLVAGWQQYRDLTEAAQRTLQVPGSTEQVALATHRVNAELQSDVTNLIDGRQVAVQLGLSLVFDVSSLLAWISAGQLVAVQSGRFDITATLAVQGADLLIRQAHLELQDITPISPGIRLTDGRPEPPAAADPRSA